MLLRLIAAPESFLNPPIIEAVFSGQRKVVAPLINTDQADTLAALVSAPRHPDCWVRVQEGGWACDGGWGGIEVGWTCARRQVHVCGTGTQMTQYEDAWGESVLRGTLQSTCKICKDF